jgi:uncharacterized protein YqeY
MTKQETIKEEIKNAMRAKDAPRLEVLRGVASAFTNELVAQKKTPQEPLDDASATNVLKRLVKQRKDSIEQFTSGGRPELAEKEAYELSVLETFLPSMMTREEIEKIAKETLSQLGAVDKSKMGVIIGSVMKACKGMADGNDVKAVVESLLA